jgi:diguanylate cyclase (GGDEF)-like protein
MLRTMRLGEKSDDRRRTAVTDLARALAAAPDEWRAAEVLRRHILEDCEADDVALISSGPERGRATFNDLTGGLGAIAGAGVPPGSCLAVRLGKPHAYRANESHLLRCELCDRIQGESATVPLIAAGTVIGAVIASGARLHPDALQRLDDAASVFGPVVAGLRSFELASAHAHTDTLTGLPNRRAVEEDVERLTALSRRSAQALTMLRIDVDGMLTLNDRVGHEIGDGVIASLATLLRGRLRSSDVVARIGGDEFLVLLPDTTPDAGVALAEGLRALTSGLTPPETDDQLTVSVGVASFPVDAESSRDLLDSAERALASAKQAGGDRVFAVEPPDPWSLFNEPSAEG